MKNIYVIWGLIIVVLLGTITFIGFNLSNQNKGYKELEKEVITAAEKYLGANLNEYPEKGRTSKLDIQKIVDYGVKLDLSVDDDVCQGYVLITSEAVSYSYKAFISCANYTTNGYET